MVKINGNEIRKGNVIEHKNGLWIAVKTSHVKPGKGGAFAQVELKNIRTNSKLNERFRSADKIERVRLEQKDYQFLYKSDGDFIFMDNETFEQITIKEDALNVITNFLTEGLVVQIEFFENEALNVSLPEKLSCVVKETEPTIKGQTAANSSKPAILDNGLRIMVPQFIAEGESIIVSTETSEKAARKASKSLIRDFNEIEKLQVVSKKAGDFVSKADLRAEKIIKEELLSARPSYGWCAEESQEIEGEDPTRRWIVDPLDGTTNFLHGIPHWAISIALEHKKEIVAGIIYDPIKDELFSAQKGGGSWLNEQRLRVSNRTTFQEMLFSTGIPFGQNDNLQNSLSSIGNLMPSCSGIRRNGAAALDLAYVAAGRFDGFWEQNLSPWDMAAGIILVKEAGGILESIEMNHTPLETGNIICSNNQETVFKKFSEIIRSSIH